MECSVMQAIIIPECRLQKAYPAVEDIKSALEWLASVGTEKHSFDHEASRHRDVRWFVLLNTVAATEPLPEGSDRFIRVDVLSCPH
jgi:hypothetical protein